MIKSLKHFENERSINFNFDPSLKKDDPYKDLNDAETRTMQEKYFKIAYSINDQIEKQINFQ